VTTIPALEDAAVLAPVFRDAGGVLRILLLLRTDRGIHGGQLGLPGGRPEPGDRDLLATALREAKEEVGLSPALVEVLAAFEPLETMATGFRVHPFLGRVPADVAWQPQPDEVVRVLTPAVAALADPDARQRLPFSSSYFPEPIEVEGIDVEGHVLWGLTLRLLDDVIPRLVAGEWPV
jgi:8-oxo-dGTP pyrophosphatase MutT (NUDIX family)